MSNKITINPITRISGFLEIQVEVEDKQIIDAKSSGMMFRGFEKMLRGRPPLDAIYFTERICGICSTSHALASTLALEDVLNIQPNKNDQMVRDFIHGSDIIQNHLRQFFQYSLPDFVHDPKIEFLQQSSHRDFRLPKKLSDKLIQDYIDSAEYSRLAHEMLATLGGKAPHNHGIFVGGVTVNMDTSKWIRVKSILSEIRNFVTSRMIPDAYIISEYYPDYFSNGVGYKNLMSYGLFHDYTDPDLFYVSPGVYMNGTYQELQSDKITENIHHAWYEANKIEQPPTELTVDENRNKENAYSWIKAPRYSDHPMEVGPLARMLLSDNYKGGISTMDRIIARVLELEKVIDIMLGFIERISMQQTEQAEYIFKGELKGKGLTDTVRGALGHWISTKDNGIQNYEIITPSAWNLSPVDSKGFKGVVEQALIGTTIDDITDPIEIGRIVRSFDPCISCATHVTSNHYTSALIRLL
jgi:hydrogenase large subunit